MPADGVAEFRAEIAEYAQRREQWAKEGNVSDRLGHWVIVVSSGHAEGDEYRLFVAEGDRLREQRAAEDRFKKVELVTGVTAADMKELLGDRKVSGVEIVSHGSFSRAWMSEKHDGRLDYSWLDAANDATHLKTEGIRQDMCGHLPSLDVISVALGIMVVERPSGVLAAVGKRIPVPNGEPRDHLFTAPYRDDGDLMPQIINVSDEHLGRIREVDHSGNDKYPA